MFKAAGFILIIISTFTVFFHTSFADRCTYIFLDQTAQLLNDICFCNLSAKTYPQLFSVIDYKKYSYYKDFSFISRVNFFTSLENNSFIINKEISDVKDMFMSMGFNNPKKEREHLAQCIGLLQHKSAYYQNRYEKQCKGNRISGLSVGLVMIIVLI